MIKSIIYGLITAHFWYGVWYLLSSLWVIIVQNPGAIPKWSYNIYVIGLLMVWYTTEFYLEHRKL